METILTQKHQFQIENDQFLASFCGVRKFLENNFAFMYSYLDPKKLSNNNLQKMDKRTEHCLTPQYQKNFEFWAKVLWGKETEQANPQNS